MFYNAEKSTPMNQLLRCGSLAASLAISIVLASCGGGSAGGGTAGLQANISDIAVTQSLPGVTPFISFVSLSGHGLTKVLAVAYVIEAKAGATSKPVTVSYSMDALKKRGYFVDGSETATLPVFGLYSGYINHVSLGIRFEDGSSQSIPIDITTAAYVDPNGIYDHPTILQKRVAGSILGFDYFALKSAYETPVVIDTDGEIRWLVAGNSGSSSSTAFQDNGFVVGQADSKNFHRIEFDGTIKSTDLIATDYEYFHHNIDPAKFGLFGEVVATVDGVTQIESILTEFSNAGAILHEWDMGKILSTYMRSQGDDPDGFVRPGVDWFHMNAASYDPRDDSVIVSSRENFIVKIDYTTGNLIWVLGDPNKYWYTYPSLRAKSLTLDAGGLYPIGQHSVSINSDGLLTVFNDGFESLNMPSGAPAGERRNYSVVSAYQIDSKTMTAHEVWDFDYGKKISSLVCSSAYEAPGKSMLINYAVADNFTHARLVGLAADRSVAFDFQYNNLAGCNTSWNAVPVNFDSMSFL